MPSMLSRNTSKDRDDVDLELRRLKVAKHHGSGTSDGAGEEASGLDALNQAGAIIAVVAIAFLIVIISSYIFVG